MTPDDKPQDGELAKLIDEQLELAAAKLPALERGAVHPSPIDHDELKEPHADFEAVMLGNAEPTPTMLEELAALENAPALSEEELARQALAEGDASGEG